MLNSILNLITFNQNFKIMSYLIDPVQEPSPSATPLDRLKYLVELSHKSQAKFATLINLDPSSMSRLLSGKMPITEQFINRVVVNLGVSKEWFAHGKGVPFPKSDRMREISDGSLVMLHPQPKGAPVYDVDVTAGVVPMSSIFTRENILGYIDLPNVNPKNPIVRVSGDSMQPRIPHGAFISIRQINDPSVIVWGATYLVQLEDYRLVKVVKPCPGQPDSIILHSENPDYDDMEVKRNSIERLFLVESVINYDILA